MNFMIKAYRRARAFASSILVLSSMALATPAGYLEIKCEDDDEQIISFQADDTTINSKVQEAARESAKGVARTVTVSFDLILDWVRDQAPHLTSLETIHQIAEENYAQVNEWLEGSMATELAEAVANAAGANLSAELYVQNNTDGFKLKGFGTYYYTGGQFHRGQWSEDSMDLVMEGTAALEFELKGEVEFNLSAPFVGGVELKVQIQGKGTAGMEYQRVVGLEKILNGTSADLKGKPHGRAHAKVDIEIQAGVSAQVGAKVTKAFTHSEKEKVTIRANESEGKCE